MKNTNKGPKILLLDIETAPTSAYVWQLYDTNAIAVIKDWYVLCYAWKWLDGKKTQVKALPDYSSYSKDREDDSKLMSDLWKIIDEADIIVAHNGDRFDLPKINARFIIHGLTPPSSYKTVDTLKICRNKFKFDSNKLNDVAKQLGIGSKLAHTGFDLWKGCMAGDLASWNLMKRYNAKDVDLLEEVYLRVRPWARTHPNANIFTRENACRLCQSYNLLKRGFNYTTTGKKQAYQCKDCGAWSSGVNKLINKLEIQ